MTSGDDWAGYGRTHGQLHYSPLADINASNVADLGLVWWYDIAGGSLPWSVPLEVNGTLYFSAGLSVIRALDAISGRLLWTHDPRVEEAAASSPLIGRGVRGIAYWNNRIYVGTFDGRLISIDSRSGKAIWSVATNEPDGHPRPITGPPLVFNGKVMIGHGGAEGSPLRGYVTTYDALTGNQLWRFYTVPGNPDRGFESKAHEMAARTWSGQWWKFGGGGTVWNAMTYDPELNRVYIGTSNGAPWNQKIRSPGGGDNLFLAAIVALDADTGSYIWHYQTNPGEVLDYDATTDMELSRLVMTGTPRRVLMQASKNGFFYVIDRDTGKLISADKFAKVTWAEKIDLSTGRPVETIHARYDSGHTTVWPGSNGAHGTNPMAFNPQTKLAYIPVHDLPAEFDATGIDSKTWSFDTSAGLNIGVKIKIDYPENTARTTGVSSLLAWDPIRQQAAWRVALPGFFNGGIATTAGGLVFQGRCDGKFVAYSAQDGKELWSFDAQAGVLGAPITYKVGTRQYVSVLAGSGGWRAPPQRLLTFALGGDAHVPTAAPNREKVTPVDDVGFKSNPAQQQDGAKLFRRCEACHGAGPVSSGTAPDLRGSSAILSASNFRSIVRDGALRAQGMPPFAELSNSEIESVRQYLRARARDLALGEPSEKP